ncbi:MAG TPA: hypothetical protein VN666_07550 [Nitrospira sp.]|nr:hypothetical protein [Nitrospira sp.]
MMNRPNGWSYPASTPALATSPLELLDAKESTIRLFCGTFAVTTAVASRFTR